MLCCNTFNTPFEYLPWSIDLFHPTQVSAHSTAHVQGGTLQLGVAPAFQRRDPAAGHHPGEHWIRRHRVTGTHLEDRHHQRSAPCRFIRQLLECFFRSLPSALFSFPTEPTGCCVVLCCVPRSATEFSAYTSVAFHSLCTTPAQALRSGQSLPLPDCLPVGTFVGGKLQRLLTSQCHEFNLIYSYLSHCC